MIHPTAYVDKSSELAADVEIGPMAYVGPKCILHSGVKLGAKATVEMNTEIGKDTMLAANAHVGGAPQDITYKGEDTRLVIGERNIIREFATIHRASAKEDWLTEVGNDCFLMSGSHIAHDCKIGNGVIMANYATLSGHIHIDDYAVLSGVLGVHQFVRIGTMSMISAGSRVGKDVPPYCTILSESIMGMNVVGMRRHGVSAESRSELKKALKILTDKSIPLDDVAEKLMELTQYDEVVIFREFVVKSKRSIMRNMFGD